ncbi:hypothetical protein [Ligilactobacillus acidipiscis]|nr:hypothetical protein [Ligilactobacillus acidipiscis]
MAGKKGAKGLSVQAVVATGIGIAIVFVLKRFFLSRQVFLILRSI